MISKFNLIALASGINHPLIAQVEQKAAIEFIIDSAAPISFILAMEGGKGERDYQMPLPGQAHAIPAIQVLRGTHTLIRAFQPVRQ